MEKQGKKIIKHGTRNTYVRHGCRCSECRACNAEFSRRNREKNPEYYREAARKSYAKNRDRLLAKKHEDFDSRKNRARCAVTFAISKGWLSRGECEVGIGCRGRIQAHHDDYDKPLEVRWLCQTHHMQLHARQRDTPEGPIATFK